jgi:hypothetical protein
MDEVGAAKEGESGGFAELSSSEWHRRRETVGGELKQGEKKKKRRLCLYAHCNGYG